VRNPNSPKKAAALTLIALFVLSCVVRAHPRRSHEHKSPKLPEARFLAGLAPTSDFDADVRQDRVTLLSNGYDKTIKIRFGNARISQVAFTAGSDDAGRLVAGDIDRDGDVDLIWVGAPDRKDAVVLINDGEGNFVEAADISQYASELDDLFSSGDRSGNHSLKRKHKTSVLASASFHDVGLPVLDRFQSTAIAPDPISIREPLRISSPYFNYLSKRGPPVFLS